jgi:hypothetical protein
MSPIEQIMAAVDWKPAPGEPDGSDIPHATHAGVLELAGHRLRCYRLNDGRTIIDADDMSAFFGGLLDGDDDGQ